MENVEHLSEIAWIEARFDHQAQWAELPELQRNEFLSRAEKVLAGEAPSDGDDNMGRFERAITAGMANRAAEAKAEVKEVDEKPKKATKTTKKAAKK